MGERGAIWGLTRLTRVASPALYYCGDSRNARECGLSELNRVGIIFSLSVDYCSFLLNEEPFDPASISNMSCENGHSSVFVDSIYSSQAQKVRVVSVYGDDICIGEISILLGFRGH